MKTTLEIEIEISHVTKMDSGESWINGWVEAQIGEATVDVPVTCYIGVDANADTRGVSHTADLMAGEDGMDWDPAHDALSAVAAVIGHDAAHDIAQACADQLMAEAQAAIDDPDSSEWADEVAESMSEAIGG